VRRAELDFATGIQIGWIAWVVLDFGGGCGIAHNLEGGTGCVPIGFSASIEGGLMFRDRVRFSFIRPQRLIGSRWGTYLHLVRK
jgi:hypothetical protein